MMDIIYNFLIFIIIVDKFYIFYYSLFHEKFRTNKIIDPQLDGTLLKYNLRGFRGTYNLTLILEDGTNIPIMDDYIL